MKISQVKALLHKGTMWCYFAVIRPTSTARITPQAFCIGNVVNRRQMHEIYKKTGIFCYTDEASGNLHACAGLVDYHRPNAGPVTITLLRQPKKETIFFPEEKEMPATAIIQYNHPQAGSSLFKIEY